VPHATFATTFLVTIAMVERIVLGEGIDKKIKGIQIGCV
jgi:hypothetical protein